MQSKQYDIFISYNRNDKEDVEKILNYLQDKYKIWFDQTSVGTGDWEDKITEAINKSLFLMACIGKNNIGNYQKIEIEKACENKIEIIPILLPNTPKEFIPECLKNKNGVVETNTNMEDLNKQIYKFLETIAIMKIRHFINTLKLLNFNEYKKDLYEIRKKNWVNQFTIIGNELVFYLQKVITRSMLLDNKEVKYYKIFLGSDNKSLLLKEKVQKNKFTDIIKGYISDIKTNILNTELNHHICLSIQLDKSNIGYYGDIIKAYEECLTNQSINQIINNHYWLLFIYINDNNININDKAIYNIYKDSNDFRYLRKTECKFWFSHHNFDHRTVCIDNFIKQLNNYNLSDYVINQLCACVLKEIKATVTNEYLLDLFQKLNID